MKKNQVVVEIDGMQVPVAIENRRSRNMYLRVKSSGDVFLTCPSYVSRADALHFLTEKEDWLAMALNRMKEKNMMLRSGACDGKAVIFGKELPAVFLPDGHSRVKIEEDRVVYFLKERNPEEEFKLFYREASEVLLQMIQTERQKWDRLICLANGFPVPEIRIRYMTSRWGSCTPLRNRISISSRLIHFPRECLSYVLLHEYAHLLVQNHSRDFYAVVERFMPDYRTYRSMLK